MLVQSGVEQKNLQKARTEILAQLDALKRGDFTDEEISAARLRPAQRLSFRFRFSGGAVRLVSDAGYQRASADAGGSCRGNGSRDT